MVKSISLAELHTKLGEFIRSHGNEINLPVYFDCLHINGDLEINETRDGDKYIELY